MSGKVGRPRTGVNFDIIKSIKINSNLEKAWDPKLIRVVLEGKLEFLYRLLQDKFKLVKNYTPEELQQLNEIEEVLNIE